MAKSLFRLLFKSKGVPALRKRLKKLKRANLQGFNKVRRAIVIELLTMADRKLAQSARGTLPRDWQPLSPITAFIRTHRAKGGRAKIPAAGVDTSVMRLSNQPFNRGANFGIENKLTRAERFNFGGATSGGSVNIGGFERKSKNKVVHRVKPYTMKLKAGFQPARPFFPVPLDYIPIVKRILKDFEKRAAEGRA